MVWLGINGAYQRASFVRPPWSGGSSVGDSPLGQDATQGNSLRLRALALSPSDCAFWATFLKAEEFSSKSLVQYQFHLTFQTCYVPTVDGALICFVK